MDDNDKEVLLATSFGKAPADLQTAANNYAASLKSISKLQKQLTDANNQLTEAEKKQGEIAKEYRAQLRAWTPEV